VDGKDPYFVWRFEHSIRTRLIAVDVEASEAGAVQLFWSSAACPTFRESCSLVEQVSAGRQWVDFLMDGATEVRELRLDLPDAVGVKLWFHEIGVFERAGAQPVGWEAPAWSSAGNLVSTWSRARPTLMTVTTPGLNASPFDSVGRHSGLGRSRRGSSDGPTGTSTRRGVRLGRADSSALTHVARLSRVATWRGPIRTVRLDPGDGAGDYTIDHIAFTGDAPNAQRARR
jgi:hypothetical protein